MSVCGVCGHTQKVCRPQEGVRRSPSCSVPEFPNETGVGMEGAHFRNLLSSPVSVQEQVWPCPPSYVSLGP